MKRQLEPEDIEALAATTRAARKIAATIPADQLPPAGEWHKVDATLVPDPDGEFEFDGVRYRQLGPARVKPSPGARS